MSIDIVDFFQSDPGSGDSLSYRPGLSSDVRSGLVKRICRICIADYFAVYAGVPSDRSIQSLQYQDTGAFGYDEAVPGPGERSAG